MDLHVLDFLLQDRERQLKQLIGNLTINEVKDDKNFEGTVRRIKSQIALTQATIGEPKITGNREVPKPLMFGRMGTTNAVTVSFPITGSKELFEYRANGGSFTLTSLYTPDYNGITIEVEADTLDKGQVLAAAEKEIAATRTLIAQNNPQVEAWTARISTQVDSMAAQKKQELAALYS